MLCTVTATARCCKTKKQKQQGASGSDGKVLNMSYNAMVLLLLQLDVIGTLLQTLIQVPTSFICNRTDEKLWPLA
jgi:hypothetical protein